MELKACHQYLAMVSGPGKLNNYLIRA